MTKTVFSLQYSYYCSNLFLRREWEVLFGSTTYYTKVRHSSLFIRGSSEKFKITVGDSLTIPGKGRVMYSLQSAACQIPTAQRKLCVKCWTCVFFMYEYLISVSLDVTKIDFNIIIFLPLIPRLDNTLWMASFGCASLGVFAGKYVQLVSIGIHYLGMKSSFLCVLRRGGGV